jgi:uncharacterized protein YgiM (DUF1202 family)
LNVRKGAGTQYPIVGSLTGNTRVEVLEQSSKWYKIKAGSITGYVSKDYIALEQPTQPSTPPATGTPTTLPTDTAPPPNQDNTGLVIATTLNIRSAPGTTNHKVGMVVKGKTLTVHEKIGDWYRITYSGIQGYVHSSYVQIQGGTPTAPAAPVVATGIVTATSLNVRSGPGTQNTKIGSLAGNSKVTLLSSIDGWHKIQSGSLVGYVDARYISTQVAAQTPARGDTARRAIVTASTLYVRSGAGTNYSAIGHLARNNQVEVLQAAGAWYKIKSGNLTGYVHGAYLKLQ